MRELAEGGSVTCGFERRPLQLLGAPLLDLADEVVHAPARLELAQRAVDWPPLTWLPAAVARRRQPCRSHASARPCAVRAAPLDRPDGVAVLELLDEEEGGRGG